MKVFLIVLIAFSLTCCSQKSKVSSNEIVTGVQTDDHVKDTLETGVIHKSADGNACAYTIKVKDLSYLLDPVNLDQEFMVEGIRVKFEYLPLRMQNRCVEAHPVQILSMAKV